MPRFDFNPRTGMMEPRQNKQIYFAKSQGGGLRIDDEKNNKKYVIERDGRITNIFGIKSELVNFYDLRDARIIADRVLRLFGRNHKYTDYHYFLKGYNVKENFIKTCSEFIEEGMFTDVIKRHKNGEIKKEDGIYIGDFEDGTKINMPPECHNNGSLVKFGDDVYYYFEELDVNIVCFNNGKHDTFYRFDDEAGSGQPNMIDYFTSDYHIREDNFGLLIAAVRSADINNIDELDGLDIQRRGNCYNFKFSDGRCFDGYDDEDLATSDAIDGEKEILQIKGVLTKDLIKRFMDNFGDDFLDIDYMEGSLRESAEFYYDELNEDDTTDELLRYNIIKKTDEYFDVDEDGEIDRNLPIYNKDDYKEQYVDAVIDSYDNDIAGNYFLSFGYDSLEEIIDFDKLAELIVDNDGRGNSLSGYDSEEHEEYINHKTYLIYRTE